MSKEYTLGMDKEREWQNPEIFAQPWGMDILSFALNVKRSLPSSQPHKDADFVWASSCLWLQR